jgi:hypothetical protein
VDSESQRIPSTPPIPFVMSAVLIIFSFSTLQPFNTIFFMGLSWPCSMALLAHPLGYPMTWSSTVKESQESTILTELPAIFKRHRLTFAVCLLTAIMQVAFAFMPMEWVIIDWV